MRKNFIEISPAFTVPDEVAVVLNLLRNQCPETMTLSIPEYEMFKIPHYSERLRPANEFLGTLSDSEIDVISESFKRISNFIENNPEFGSSEFESGHISAIMLEISRVFSQLGIPQRIRDYVNYNPNMIIPRPFGDSEGASLTRADWVQINIISIVMKIIFPIVGLLMKFAGNDITIKITISDIIAHMLYIFMLGDAVSTIQYYVSAVVIKALNQRDIDFPTSKPPVVRDDDEDNEEAEADEEEEVISEHNESIVDIKKYSTICLPMLFLYGFVYADLYSDKEGILYSIETWVAELVNTIDLD